MVKNKTGAMGTLNDTVMCHYYYCYYNFFPWNKNVKKKRFFKLNFNDYVRILICE